MVSDTEKLAVICDLLTDRVEALEKRVGEVEESVHGYWSIHVGQYEIRQREHDYWIAHESGEGMGVSKDKFEALITQFYADNF